MTWLAPWALAAGALGMLGVVAAHLLSRQRPRALTLATTRFLPGGMLEATTLQKIPMDRWWMLLRLLVIALLALGVAQPVLTGSRVPTRTLLLLDRSLPLDAQRTVLSTLAATDVVIAYDSATAIGLPSAVTPSVADVASLGAGLGRLVRVRDSLAERSTTLRVAIASRFSPRSLDPVTASIRALVPDSIVVVPVAIAKDSAVARGPIAVRADGDDPIAATAHLLGDSVARVTTRIVRGAPLTADDSSAARAGATIVWWPSRALAGAPALRGLAVGSATWIAPLGVDSSNVALRGAQAIGWWADGSPAVWRVSIGRGCLLRVAVAVPAAGDQTLSLAAQAWLAALVTSCDREQGTVGAAPDWLRAPTRTRSVTASQATLSSPLAVWFVGLALALAALELLLRKRA